MSFTTRLSILGRIMDGDQIGWQEFYDMYKPLIYLRGSDRGLTAEEREDLLQNVMVSIFKSEIVLKFDSERGRFRTFLKTIIDRRAFDILRRRRPEDCNLDTLEEQGVFLQSSDFDKLERRWDTAWRKHSLNQALPEVQKQVNEVTYRAFERIVLEGKDPKKVAEELGISTASAYMAKHRVLARLRSFLENMEENE